MTDKSSEAGIQIIFWQEEATTTTAELSILLDKMRDSRPGLFRHVVAVIKSLST